MKKLLSVIAIVLMFAVGATACTDSTPDNATTTSGATGTTTAQATTTTALGSTTTAGG